MPFDFSVPNWEARLRKGLPPVPALPVNEDRARRAVLLFDSLQLPDVPKMPRLAEAAGDWFREIVRLALAAEDPENGAPLVNEAFVLVPKKNSKTTYSAALGLTALLLWERPNAELLILGPTQNVAERCFRQAAGMIKANPKLAKIFHVQEHLKRIKRVRTGATLQVKTFDLNVVTGEIPALTIIDELHVIAGKSYADRVIAQITGGMVTNPSAVCVYITTQSDTPPRGVFKAKLDYARRVRDGQIGGQVNFLPVLYEFPEKLQVAEGRPWADPDLWPMVTPNLGLSVNMDILRKNFAQAQEDGPEALAIWASQHLNIQIGLGLHDERWVGADYWAARANPALDLDAILASSDVAVIGADVGGADDLFALHVVGRHAETRRWQTWTKAWASEDALTRRKSIASTLRDFERDGDLVITPDGAEHVAQAADVCERVRDAGLLPEKNGIGLDPWGVAALRDELMLRGFTDEEVVGVSQGYRLSGAIKGLERRLMDGALVHAGQPLMDWCVGNAQAVYKGNNVYITKEAAGVAKIDCLVALFNAAMLMDLNPEAARGGVSIPAGYELC
ncbi:MAG: terminase large subunit [Rhodosalinus sp.]